MQDDPRMNSGAHSPPGKVQGLELGAFLLLVVPSMFVSLFGMAQTNLEFMQVAVASIFRNAGLVGLVLYFLWRNKEPFAAIGLHARDLPREIFVGVLLFLPMYLLLILLEFAARKAGLGMPEGAPSFLIPTGITEHSVAYILLITVALSEEILFRGYLIRRFQAVLKNTWATVACSSVIFALGHIYEGAVGVLAVGLLGVFFAVVYLWRGSLIAPIVLHFLQNLMGMIVLPSLGT